MADPRSGRARETPAGIVGDPSHVVGVAAFDEENEEFVLDDTSARPITIDAGRLRYARRSNAAVAHRMLRVNGARSAVDPVRAAIEGAVAGTPASELPVRVIRVPGASAAPLSGL